MSSVGNNVNLTPHIGQPARPAIIPGANQTVRGTNSKTEPASKKRNSAGDKPVERLLPQDGSMEYGTHPLHDDFMELYAEGLAATKMKDNVWRRPRFFQLMQMFRLTSGLNGVTAECGVFRGLSSLMLCHYTRTEQPNYAGENHFMIDSYEGLSEPTSEDGTFSKARFDAGAFTSTSVEGVRQTLGDFPKVNLVQGWIPEVFGDLREMNFRFVHIDVDLYAPTLASLRYFYPRMVKGGVIVVDDYGPWPEGNWPGCRTALEEFSAETRVPHAGLDTGNCVIIRR